MMRSAMERGKWVFFQNCHLAPSFMPSLERLVENIDPDKVRSRVVIITLCAVSHKPRFYHSQIHFINVTVNYTSLLTGPPRLPAVANQHAKPQVPSLHFTEWFKNDRGTSSGD